MIQSAQVASKFTLFTHHAKTFPNLVTALRNSMLRTGVFKDEKTAEEQVVQVLNFDIHLVKDFRGRRYIERVTECVPVEEKNEYTFDHRKEKTLEGKFDKFFDNATIFFTKETNRELYKYHNVLEFVDDTYVLTNPISPENIKGMRENMNDTDVVAFDAFLERNWGIKPPKLPKYDENGNEIVEESKQIDESSVQTETHRLRAEQAESVKTQPISHQVNTNQPGGVAKARITKENETQEIRRVPKASPEQLARMQAAREHASKMEMQKNKEKLQENRQITNRKPSESKNEDTNE